MKKIKSILLCFVLICLFFQCTRTEAFSYTNDEYAIFSLVLQKSTFFDPEIISFDITLDAPTSTVNAVGIKISFDPQALELATTSLEQSACTMVVEEKIDNINGRYDLVCGSNVPFENINNHMAGLTFKKLKAGQTRITIESDSEALTADGAGGRLPSVGESFDVFVQQ